jgi:hypothetical protein
VGAVVEQAAVERALVGVGDGDAGGQGVDDVGGLAEERALGGVAGAVGTGVAEPGRGRW